MFISQLEDEQDMIKLNQKLKEESNKQPVDIEAITYFWRKTFISRRLFTRTNTTKEILLEYPAYSLPALVGSMKTFLSSGINHLSPFQIFEEVRMTTDTDIERNVELFLPVLLEKIPENLMFVSGKIIFNKLK
jgi:hypothetical protein